MNKKQKPVDTTVHKTILDIFGNQPERNIIHLFGLDYDVEITRMICEKMHSQSRDISRVINSCIPYDNFQDGYYNSPMHIYNASSNTIYYSQHDFFSDD
jgi:hypothetical protein